jgi:hypothetical protein
LAGDSRPQARRGAAASAGGAAGDRGARGRRDGGGPEQLGDAFLEAGAESLKARAGDDRDATIDRLRTKVGELTMDTELLQAKIERLEAGGGGGPFGSRRSKR